MMTNSPIPSVKPIAGALGAEITGINLSKTITTKLFNFLHQALMDYKVIFFRDQDLTPQQHIDFSRLFGEPMTDEFIEHSGEHPELMELYQAADSEKRNFGGTWHTDSTYRNEPPLGVSLYSRKLPPYGGDTIWSNMELVYESLSDPMKNMLKPLYADHLASGYRQKLSLIKGDYTHSFSNDDVKRIEVSHPVVRAHPVTGRPSLFLSEPYTYRFSGMSEEESKPLIQFLCELAIRPNFTCRFNWTPGTLALWDNRNTLHFAVNDYAGYSRLMHRYTIKGDKPRGVKV
jgi:taurine dioxygenase